MADTPDTFAAAPSALGYFYQPRFALYYLLQLDETAHVLIEKDDDLDFKETDGKLTLASLKHKKEGETLTDLATDYWKSVRVSLASYKIHKSSANLRFFLFTTATATGPFSKLFVPDAKPPEDGKTLAQKAKDMMAGSKAEIVDHVKKSLEDLSDAEKEDFFSRIKIFDSSPRVEDLPALIKNNYMRTVKTNARNAVFQRLEGWWGNEILLLLTKQRVDPIIGQEVSDMLCSIADEYKADNLPITFGESQPDHIDVAGDNRLFVAQLREIGISSERIHHAIIDYYRAFEQRSAWARESLLVSGEIERYERRLTEEWQRYSAIVFDSIPSGAPEEALKQKGDELYKWAQMQCMHLKIRPRVDEAFVVRGNFQILANVNPPGVYWHPQFLAKLDAILGSSK
ncbi:MAG: hypothetical protein K2X77_07180 [Candidatus Obscuribacterales bacterium]|nr:hypothetical protein [Candidatus Obscuribacterales bacterium]